MSFPSGKHLVRFGVFEFDTTTGDLWKGGRRIKLQNQPRQILKILVSRPGELVTREELRGELWPEDTFVDFDASLNAAIRKIRDALGDVAPSPRFIETERSQGYRFSAPVAEVQSAGIDVTQATRARATEPALLAGPASDAERAITISGQSDRPVRSDAARGGRHRRTRWVATALTLTTLVAVAALLRRPATPTSSSPERPLSYTQLTNFTDSAVAPALSPDGRMVAFFRSKQWFLSPDQVWVKMLPNGDPVQVTNLPQAKYGLTFSPDGSRIAFTMTGVPGWRTVIVSTFGGNPSVLLQNAAGLSWIGPDQVLFSEIRQGLHMGIVTARENRAERRELYFPAHERAMAHYSYLSPDRRWVLVVEMDHATTWQRCRVLPFDGSSHGRQVGPPGNCTSAAWSPDGVWMYFSAVVDGSSHLWRQRFPDDEPEQLTFGPNEESGIAMFPDGRSMVTSVGTSQTAIWMRDTSGERQLTSQGIVETATFGAVPRFSDDGKYLFYLLHRDSPASASELWRFDLEAEQNEAVVTGFSIAEYDVSPDGNGVLFWTEPLGRPSQMWMASLDGGSPPVQVGQSGDAAPQFGPDGEIVFRTTESHANYLMAMKRDGSARRKLSPDPIANLHRLSPDSRWAIVLAPFSTVAGAPPSTLAIPLNGGSPREICPVLCPVQWAVDASFMEVGLTAPSLANAGATMVIPLKQGEMVPHLPAGGVRNDPEVARLLGAHVVKKTDWSVPRTGQQNYAFVRRTTHSNLFRVTLP